jgi:threonine dehydrogenase-like Zn-dependent dehydrogenase
VLEKVRQAAGGGGPSRAVDCSGVPSAQRLCIEACRRRGHIAIVGEGGAFELKASDDCIRKGITIHGCWHYNYGDIPRIFEVIRSIGSLLDKQITHTFALQQVQAAFELQLAGQCGKVLLLPFGPAA